MSVNEAEFTSKVYFYIGESDSDDEDEGFESDCPLYPTPYIPLLTHIWNDTRRKQEDQDPPLDLAMKELRILKGLERSTQDIKKSFANHNAPLNYRVSKVSASLLEYQERLCAQVTNMLEERENQDLSGIKAEIKEIKEQIQNTKRLSNDDTHTEQKEDNFHE